LIGIKANKELSHNSIRNAINAVLANEEGFTFLVDVFAKHVIVEKEGVLLRRNFKITSSGKVKLDEDATPVRFEADFVDLVTNEEDIMDKDKFVVDLIANEASKFEEGDTEWLTGLDEAQLEKMVPVEVAAPIVEPTPVVANVAPKEPVVTNSGDGGSAGTPQTLDEYVAAAPSEMQEVLNSGLRAFNSRKSELTAQIKANSKNKFSDEDLKGMGMSTLENLAALAVTEDYTMKGGPRLVASEDPNYIPPSEPVFDLSRKSASNGAAKE